jgi:uncharacterized protein YdhG (YjbR/CyaY superfamily)
MEKFISADEYIAAATSPGKELLEEMRAIIKMVAPEAEERTSYGMVGYFFHGALVYIGSFKNHVSLFGAGSKLFEQYRKELENYKTSKGTIQFPLDQPLPKELIEALVRDRITENEARASTKNDL